jgi:hypothetical protein
MALDLDLSSSDAKIARAREHFESIKFEFARAANDRQPYGIRISQIDPDSGWFSVFLTPRDFAEPRLGVIVGDLIHNLRCALDYIITALADKSKAQLTTRHQFPIFDHVAEYRRKVGDRSTASKDGMLGGIVHGISTIWDAQPFHRKPDPETDGLFLINRFSNADKHRVISNYMPLPGGGSGQLFYGDGVLLERIESTPFAPWEPNVEYEVARYRFARPYPSVLRFNGDITVQVLFGTAAFGKYKLGHALGSNVFNELCDHVAMIADLFKAL